MVGQPNVLGTLTPKRVQLSTYSHPSFSSSNWKRDGVRMYKLGEALNATNDK